MINKLSFPCVYCTKVYTPEQLCNNKDANYNLEIEVEFKTWFLGCKGYFFFANEGIDKGGFTDIGPTKNGKLGAVILGAILGSATAFHELHLLYLGVTRIGTNHNVGTG